MRDDQIQIGSINVQKRSSIQHEPTNQLQMASHQRSISSQDDPEAD